VGAAHDPGAGARARAALDLGPDDLVVAMVTVLRAGKGHEVALAALPALRERFPRLRLLVLGDGPARAQIERLAAPLGPAVVFAGHRDDVPDLLAGADVLLHPTARDALPSALLEAMAAGVPVVASRVGGVPEVVVDGETGLLVSAPPSAGVVTAALARLLGDPELRARLGKAGRTRYEREFTAERWAGRLRSVYEEVGATSSRGG
jgi:glycosyltransferase involved in cell wall biosynthesis